MNTMIDYVEETMKEKFDLVKLLNILKKNIKLLLILPAICLVVSAALTFFVMPDKYTASTQILVNMKKSSSDLAFQNVQSSLQSVNTYTEIIKSPRILDKVSREFGGITMTNTRRSTSSLIVHEQPKSPISEKFRGIRSNIMFANPDSAVQSIVITSEAPGAGKSTIAANLAVAYAQAGYKTLIVDGDMRKPTQHYIFNLPNNEGLSSLLLNWSTYQDSIISTEIQDLDVLTSGPIPPNPSELITSRAFANLYDTLLMNYNFVIIDTPPVNTVTDAQLFSKFTGNVVYVVNSENNNKDEVKKGKELIEATGAKLLGVVLNRMPKDKSASYYAYYGTDES